MARLDYSGVPDVAAQITTPNDYQHIEANPNQFGAQVAEGVSSAGEGAVKASEFYGQVAADQATNNLNQQAQNLLYGDPSKTTMGPDGTPVVDTGFKGLRGADAMSASGEVSQRLDQLITEQRENLTTPISQYQFDVQSRRYRAEWAREIGEHTDQEQKNWSIDTNNTSALMAQNQIARDAENDDSVSAGREALRHAYVKNAQLKGEDPNGAILKADQDASMAQLRSLIVRNPARAQKVLDDNTGVLGGLPNYDSISRSVKEAVINSQLSPAIDSAVTDATGAAAQMVAKPQPAGAPGGSNANNLGNVKDASGGFASPATPLDGATLAANNLRAPGYRGLTITQIGKRWVGTTPYDINNWVKNVSTASGLPADEVPNLDDPSTLGSLLRGISVAEKGKGDLTAFTPDVISQGVQASLSGRQPTLGAAGAQAPSGYPSVADALNATMSTTLDKAQTTAETLFPNYPDAQERYVNGVERRLNQAVAQQHRQYEVDTHIVQQALASDHPPISEQQLIGMGPQVANAWRSVQMNNPMAAMRVENVFDANARGKSLNLGTEFDTMLHRVLAPAGDPSRVTNESQLWPYVQAGDEGSLTNTGLARLSSIMDMRSGPQGEAAAMQLSRFFDSAHTILAAGQNPEIGSYDPKGEASYHRFLMQAFPAIEANIKAGNPLAQILAPRGELYNSIFTFDRPLSQKLDEVIRDPTAGTPANASAPQLAPGLDARLKKQIDTGNLNPSEGEQAKSVMLDFQSGKITRQQAGERLSKLGIIAGSVLPSVPGGQ